MFPARYFAQRQYAPRYFPNVGATSNTVAGPYSIAQREIFSAGTMQSLSYQAGDIERETFVAGVTKGEIK